MVTLLALAGCGSTQVETATSVRTVTTRIVSTTTRTLEPSAATTSTAAIPVEIRGQAVDRLHPRPPCPSPDEASGATGNVYCVVAPPTACPAGSTPVVGGGCVFQSGACPGSLVANPDGNLVCPEAEVGPQPVPTSTGTTTAAACPTNMVQSTRGCAPVITPNCPAGTNGISSNMCMPDSLTNYSECKTAAKTQSETTEGDLLIWQAGECAYARNLPVAPWWNG